MSGNKKKVEVTRDSRNIANKGTKRQVTAYFLPETKKARKQNKDISEIFKEETIHFIKREKKNGLLFTKELQSNNAHCECRVCFSPRCV